MFASDKYIQAHWNNQSCDCDKKATHVSLFCHTGHFSKLWRFSIQFISDQLQSFEKYSFNSYHLILLDVFLLLLKWWWQGRWRWRDSRWSRWWWWWMRWARWYVVGGLEESSIDFRIGRSCSNSAFIYLILSDSFKCARLSRTRPLSSSFYSSMCYIYDGIIKFRCSPG